MIKLLYLFNLAEALACTQEKKAFTAEAGSAGRLLPWLGRSDEKYQRALGDGGKLQVTINKQFLELISAIKNGDEIAFFPAR